MIVLGMMVGVDAVRHDGCLIADVWGETVEREIDCPFVPVRLTADVPVIAMTAGSHNITT